MCSLFSSLIYSRIFRDLEKKSLGGSKYKRAPISHGKTQDFLFKSWWLKICPDFACNDCKGRRPVIQLTRRQENCACVARAKFIPYIFLAGNWKSAKRMQWVANQKRRPEKQQLLYLVVGAWDVSEIRFSTQSPHHEREYVVVAEKEVLMSRLRVLSIIFTSMDLV